MRLIGGREMRDQTRPGRTSARKSTPATPQDKQREAALAKARCTEIAMLAAARGWGKKK
jgi:hypothetical protein